MKLNFIKYIYYLTLLVFFVGCKDDSDKIIVIGGDPQNQEDDRDNEQEEEENEEEEDGNGLDAADIDWNLFSPYSCYTPLSSETFDIMTWNVQFFPKRGNTTLNKMAELILNSDADLIALQEIEEQSMLSDLITLLPGWNFKFEDVRGELELGYLYKESEIISISNLSIIYPNNTSAFYRPPVLTTVEHINGQVITFINIHLKCCGGQENFDRRQEASILLKTHIDDKLSNEKVIILGDFNDDIHEANNPFLNFIEDSKNYYFADMEIANSSTSYYSYPSWPSHLDHILVTDELFLDLEYVTTNSFNSCISGYANDVSDHRPVMVSIK